MKVKKVRRKLAVNLNDGKIGRRFVDAFVLFVGKNLFAFENMETKRWVVAHRQTGTLVGSNFVNRQHAFGFMQALYRRDKKWNLGSGVEFGMRIIQPKGRLSDHLSEVEKVYQYGNVFVVLLDGTETVVGLGDKYCVKCGCTRLRCFGYYIFSGASVEQDGKPKKIRCMKCKGVKFSVF